MHTPWPWTIEQDDELQGMPFIPIFAPSASGEKRICEVAPGLLADGIFAITEETRANARLIAAAPDLLEALDKIFSIVSYVNIHGVGKQPEATPEIGPQPLRCPHEEFWRLFQQIGKLSSDALAKAEP
jgi:hypothetical protein